MTTKTSNELNNKGKALAAAYRRCRALEEKHSPNMLFDLRYRIQDRIDAHNTDVDQHLWRERGYVIHSLV